MEGGSEMLRTLDAAMEGFRKTNGLVLDVRGNGGGTRDALKALLPYFMDPEAGPQVVNAGALRLAPGATPDADGGYLSNRSMYPLGWPRWTKGERRAVARFQRTFQPAWTLPEGMFSEWHYMVLSPSKVFYYRRPVVVLMDTGCFSATDIFLGAFAQQPGVTLMGTPSGGGSGRSRSITLVESGLRLRLSSMASFQPTGALYDGVGIQPDVLVPSAPKDFLQGGGDTSLEVAIRQLR